VETGDRVCCPGSGRFDHALNLGDATDMGTNDTLPNGQPAPAPKVYDIDGILNPGVHDCGAARARRPRHLLHRGRFGWQLLQHRQEASRPRTTPVPSRGVLGNALSVTRALPQHQLSGDRADHRGDDRPQCAAKGFDAVETDLDETTPARWRVGVQPHPSDEVA